MKKNFRLLALAAVLICCVFLAGCNDPYMSSYNATGFVHEENDTSANMSFSEFSGKKVFKLNIGGDGSKKMTLEYNLKLEVGKATVYYDIDGRQTKITSVNSNESIEDKIKNLQCTYMYIIVETSTKCLNGSFRFNVKTQ